MTALADAGEADRSQATLEEWPAQEHDGRYWRLRGRFELEHDHLSQQAVNSLQKALRDFPQDWRTHYRLARALKNLGRLDEARREAETVSRLRELLDPLFLVPRLEASFAQLDKPTTRESLAEVCAGVGLDHLADAWRAVSPVSTQQ